jgi:hypothetical protein
MWPLTWLPQPADWGRYSVESQLADEHRDVLLASGPVAGGSLPPDTAAWLGT